MPFIPGDDNINRQGRPKGVSNKLSTDLREMFADFLNDNATRIQGWFDSVAETRPDKALELYIKLSEMVIPKLKAIAPPEEKKDIQYNVRVIDSTEAKEQSDKIDKLQEMGIIDENADLVDGVVFTLPEALGE